MRRVLTIVIVATFGFTACGRSSSPPRIVTVSSIDEKTRAAHTARLRGEFTMALGNTEKVTGDVNFDQHAFHIRSVARNGTTTIDIISIGERAYGRGSPGHGLPSQWCPLKLTEVIDPGAVLDSLKKSHATLQLVGEETIDRVDATHYHVTQDDETFEMWVDGSDRLRRITQTDGYASSTGDLYDFGADIAPIEAPSTKGCPQGQSLTATITAPPQP